MANRHRGEVEACLDGRTYNLCLTLGALAELEASFGDHDMLALAERFGSGRISAGDAIKVIAAGLRGGGHDIDENAVGAMHAEGGAAGFVDIVARLLAATFGGGNADADAESDANAEAGEAEAVKGAAATGKISERASATGPFPGTT